MDFVIWRLFRRSTFYRPSHLLCHGFQRSNAQVRDGPQKTAHAIPGLVSHYRNTSVETLKGPLWCRLHAVLGQGGDIIMLDTLLDCGLFSPVQGDRGNFIQLSGVPLSELKPLAASGVPPIVSSKENSAHRKPRALVSENRTPSAIRFVRNRILYARAALNAKGGVRFGMRHIRRLQ